MPTGSPFSKDAQGSQAPLALKENQVSRGQKVRPQKPAVSTSVRWLCCLGRGAQAEEQAEEQAGAGAGAGAAAGPALASVSSWKVT